MQTRNRNTFTTIHTEGALLPFDLLLRISENDSQLEGLNAESYHLAPGEKLNEAINRSWNRLNGIWGAFQSARERLGANDAQGAGGAGTTLTRERWLLPLFQELGFGRLSTTKAVEIEGKSYPISHRWHTADAYVPLHLVGCGIELDKRTPGAAGASRTSPHSLMQEYLNRSDDVQWGVISNGLGLRILRDNATLTRQAYIEFDLESMFDGEVYSDFVLLWLACHQSRFETSEKLTECILEQWSKSAQERGTRALDDLRRGVEGAIVSLGQGFLQHPLNGELRNQLKKGDLSAQDYYRQLLRLVYRLIFLFTAEDRDLLLIQDAPVEARQRYQNYYSTTRLRALAERQRGSRHHDRYEALRLVMTLLGSDKGCPELAIPALGGFLFDTHSTADLNDTKLDNKSLLVAVRSLAFITEGNARRAVDYRNLGPEELGSVYESLLELHPMLNTDAGTFQLTSAAGNERKTTGSYYTPSSLIQVLLDSALDPVIEDRLKGKQDAAQQELALLDLKVCDPACGSGHFLIAAAHRIAGKLAELRAGGDEPSPNETRRALRDVIRHCIFGVDINPMAVDLCKVNLWLESLEPGKPLSFLDAHIQCGDSLIGVGPGMDISEIPDEAFNPAFGDDKATASALKKRNKAERAGQMGFDIYLVKDKDDLHAWMAHRAQSLDELPEETAEQVGQKSQSYQEYLASPQYQRKKMEYNLWTAAFFWKMEAQPVDVGILAPTQEMLRRLRAGDTLPPELFRRVEELAVRINFLHWELRFPKVFADKNPGFNCMLGNPPWERVQPEAIQFFSITHPELLVLNRSERENAIKKLETTDPTVHKEWLETRKLELSITKFLKISGRFPLSTSKNVNSYAVFHELALSITTGEGRSGQILQSGIATDDINKDLFKKLMNENLLVDFFDFENRRGLFADIDSRMRFCLITCRGQKAYSDGKPASFAFYCYDTGDISSKNKKFHLSSKELKTVSPNTGLCPTFRTNIDAQLVFQIYQRIGAFVIEIEPEINPWNVTIRRIFSMSYDSSIYQTSGNVAVDPDRWKRVYEAKYFHQFDHRFSSDSIESGSISRDVSSEVIPRYWAPSDEVDRRISAISWHRKYLIGYRDITNSTNERTCIACLLPYTATSDTIRVVFPLGCSATHHACLLANLNSLVFDYVARNIVASTHLSEYIIKQLPVLAPNAYSAADIAYISEFVLELVYTAYDLRPFAEDMGYHGEPFRWDEDRRALLRAELDAYFARLYGLTRDELRYILDPQDVYGPDFPGETFRVLKEKEIKLYGEFRTRRLVLEAWDRLERGEIQNVVEQPLQTITELQIEISSHRHVPDITWIPVLTTPHQETIISTPIHRQAVGVSWLIHFFGTCKYISKFKSQKYCYFIQRKGLADLDIKYHEFARGPYSPEVTYQAGIHAKKKNYWEVKGNKIYQGRNINEALSAVNQVITNIDEANLLVKRLADMPEEDLGGIATVDFAGRELINKGQVINQENIKAYFQTDWPEKVNEVWYTPDNINRAFELLYELGLMDKSVIHQADSLPMKSNIEDDLHQSALGSQLMLSDFGLYKCEICGKLVMGYEKVYHEQEIHGGKSVEWKKVR